VTSSRRPAALSLAKWSTVASPKVALPTPGVEAAEVHLTVDVDGASFVDQEDDHVAVGHVRHERQVPAVVLIDLLDVAANNNYLAALVRRSLSGDRLAHGELLSMLEAPLRISELQTLLETARQ
jgi:hypothetical protein